MDVKTLRSGMQCTLSDGSLAEVQGILPDNVHVRVRYLDTLDNPEIRIGEVREVPFEELIAEYMGTHAEGLTQRYPRSSRRARPKGTTRELARGAEVHCVLPRIPCRSAQGPLSMKHQEQALRRQKKNASFPRGYALVGAIGTVLVSGLMFSLLSTALAAGQGPEEPPAGQATPSEAGPEELQEAPPPESEELQEAPSPESEELQEAPSPESEDISDPAIREDAPAAIPPDTAPVPGGTRPTVIPMREATELQWLFCGWRKIPTVTVSAPQDDPRIALAHEAVEFWNRQLEEMGSRFRLGKVTHTTNLVPADYLRRLSEQPALQRELAPANPDLDKIPGGLIIAMSDGEFGSFTACARRGGPLVIGIRSDRVPPLALPNVARNVIAHELGHAIGLMHNDDPSKLMCGRPAACRPNAFRSDVSSFFPLTEQEKRRLLQFYPANWEPAG